LYRGTKMAGRVAKMDSLMFWSAFSAACITGRGTGVSDTSYW
jgi:hypothetical protein